MFDELTPPHGFRPPTPSQDAARGLVDELNATLERARDERFRLIRLVKDAESRLGGTIAPQPLPTEGVERLARKVESLNEALEARGLQLQQAEDRINERMEQLRRLEIAVRNMAEQFAQGVRQARTFDDDVAAAKRRIAADVDGIMGEVRDHITEQCREVAEKLDRLEAADRAIEGHSAEAERVVQQCSGAMQRQLARVLGEFVEQSSTEAEGTLASLAGRLDAELEARIDLHRQTLAEREDGMAIQLQERFAEYQAGLTEHLDRASADISARLTAEHAERCSQLQAQMHALAERAAAEVEESLKAKVDALVEASESRADAMTQAVQARIDATFDQVACESDAVAAKMQQSLAELAQQAAQDVAALGETTQKGLREKVVEAMSKATNLSEAFTRQLESAAAEQRLHLEAVAQRCCAAMDEQVLKWNEDIISAAASVERKVGEMLARYDHEADTALEPLRTRLQAKLDEVREDGEHQIASLLDQAEEKITTAKAQAAAVVTEAEEALARRILAMRPQAEAELGSLEETLEERLRAIAAEARHRISDTELALYNEMQTLRPKVEGAAKQAEQIVREQVESAQKQIEESLSPIRRQTLDELERLAERTQQVRQLMASIRATPGNGGVDVAAIVDPQRALEALDKLASRLGYRVQPAERQDSQQAA